MLDANNTSMGNVNERLEEAKELANSSEGTEQIKVDFKFVTNALKTAISLHRVKEQSNDSGL